MPPLRVVLVAEDPLARSGLLALLGGAADVQARAAARGDLAEEAAGADVLLWDLGPRGDDELPRLHAAPLLALVPDEAAASRALARGARGVLLRSTEPPRLLAALRALAQGLWVVDEGLGALLQRRGDGPEPAERLSPREREVLELLGQGLSNKLIADRLRISEHTAKFHVNAILEKLGASTRTEAVMRAARLGLLSI